MDSADVETIFQARSVISAAKDTMAFRIVNVSTHAVFAWPAERNQEAPQSTLSHVPPHHLIPRRPPPSSPSLTLHFIHHTFLYPVTIIFPQHMSQPSQPVPHPLHNIRHRLNPVLCLSSAISTAYHPHLCPLQVQSSTLHTAVMTHVSLPYTVARLKITVARRTMSDQIWQMSEQLFWTWYPSKIKYIVWWRNSASLCWKRNSSFWPIKSDFLS